MILIVRGGAAAVRARVLGREGLPVEGAPPGVAWGALRRLIGQLRAEVGEAAVMEALLPQADAVSLVLRRLAPADPDRQARLAASEDGMLTHNGVVKAELHRGLHRALAPLVAARTLLVPDVGALDLDSLGLLIGLAAPREDQAITLALGVPEREAVDHPLWRREPDQLAGLLDSLALREDVVLEMLDPGEPGTDLPTRAAVWDPLDDQLEQRGQALLAQDEPLSAAETALVLEAGRRAFASWDFHAALRLCLGLLERAPALAPLERARLHRRAALSAYNRQVGGEGNLGLADWLDHHLLAAWQDEPDPAARSHLAYRLCINRGRRRGELEEGERWGLEAITLAADPRLAPGLSAWLLAWGRNGLAYIRSRQGRLDEAIALMELAFQDAARAGGEGVPEVELPWTATVLADNLAELHWQAGALEAALRWQDTLAALEASAGVPPVFSSRRKGQILRAQRRLREAERAASAGLEAASATQNPGLEDLYRMDRADLRYRLGAYEQAWADYEVALALRLRGGDPLDRREARVSAALAASMAGAADRALALLDEALEELGDPGVSAELLAGQALVAARAGECALAEERMNLAIASAVALGARDVLLRVAVAAGESLQALGQREPALRAFRQAREIAETGETPPPAADRLAALLGLLGQGEDALLLEEALALLPEALEEAQTWTRLGALLAVTAAQDLLLLATLREELGAARPAVP